MKRGSQRLDWGRGSWRVDWGRGYRCEEAKEERRKNTNTDNGGKGLDWGEELRREYDRDVP